MTNSFGLYVHIPFCTHRCSYCDFYSSAKFAVADFETLVSALHADIAQGAATLRSVNCVERQVTSLFLGGGTPSLLPPLLLKNLLAQLRSYFAFAAATEITLEANPETVTADLASAWLDAGVNRVSMGAQSLQPQHLKKLERLASPQQVEKAMGILRAVGFQRLNLDFIIGIPGQSASDRAHDFACAFAWGATHVSAYTLTLKPGHPLYRELPDADENGDIYEEAVAALAAKGYQRYEVSNFAFPKEVCAHNLLYWTGGDYLGFGPSAASRLFLNGVFHHRKSVSDFAQFAGRASEAWQFELSSPYQTQLEAVFLELRTSHGIHLPRFVKRYGYNPTCAEKFQAFVEAGFIKKEGEQLMLSSKGFLLVDSIAEALAPSAPLNH